MKSGHGQFMRIKYDIQMRQMKILKNDFWIWQYIIFVFIYKDISPFSQPLCD